MNFIKERMTDIVKQYDSIREGFISNYDKDNKKVPRVTHILSDMIHNDYLMKWSNSLGFKHINYTKYMSEAADKGTITHSCIEYFLNNNEDPDINKFISSYSMYTTDLNITINNTYNSFKQWWNIVNKNEVEIVYVEKTLVCDEFAGTLDCLLKINNKYWLIDFKTSTHMNYKYCLQLAAYRDMLKRCENIEVDGCIVLKLNKDMIKFEEYVLDFSDPIHLKFINDCTDTFYLLTQSYYSRYYTEREYNNIFKK